MRALPMRPPRSMAVQRSAASRPTSARAVVKCTVCAVQVLRADVVDLGAVADDDLDDAVQVPRRAARVLLDDRDLRVRLGDDEDAERGARALLGDGEREVQRPLER